MARSTTAVPTLPRPSGWALLLLWACLAGGGLRAAAAPTPTLPAFAPGEAVFITGPDGVRREASWIGLEAGYVSVRTPEGITIQVPMAWVHLEAATSPSPPTPPPPAAGPASPAPGTLASTAQKVPEKEKSRWKHTVRINLYSEFNQQLFDDETADYTYLKREFGISERSEYLGTGNEFRLEPSWTYTQENRIQSKNRYALKGFWDYKLPHRLYTHFNSDNEYNHNTSLHESYLSMNKTLGLGVRILDTEKSLWRLGAGVKAYYYDRDYFMHEYGPNVFTRWRFALPWRMSLEGQADYTYAEWSSAVRDMGLNAELTKRFGDGLTLTLSFEYERTILEDEFDKLERKIRWLLGYEF